MPSCVFRRCTNHTLSVKDKNVSFHSLPKDEIIREKWLMVIRAQRREEDWMPSAYTTVCSKHFLASDIYTTKKNYSKIKKTAVPVIKQETIISSPTNLEDVQLSEEDEILESAMETIYKKKIRKIEIENRNLKLKNYNLTRKNKRLKEKYNNLVRLLSKLRNKFIVSVNQNEPSSKSGVDFTKKQSD